MNERMFKRLINTFSLETKLKQSRNNNMVILIQSTHPFQSGLSMNDYNIHGHGTAAATLENLCGREGLIKQAAVIPSTAYNPFENLYAEWVRISEKELANSYLVYVSWNRSESNNSLSTSINLKEYVMAQMV